MDKLWLPGGHHWDLHIIRLHGIADAGSFTGGGNKLVLHTTESDRDDVDTMDDVLVGKRAAPHFLYGIRPGVKHPIVYQFIPLNRAGRALGNDVSDGFQTNRANAWQIEISGFAKDAANWPRSYYKGLANLVELIRHRVDIPNKAPQDFSRPQRMTDSGWVRSSGYVGHSMAPDNDHWDPGHFHEGWLIDDVKNMPSGGWQL